MKFPMFFISKEEVGEAKWDDLVKKLTPRHLGDPARGADPARVASCWIKISDFIGIPWRNVTFVHQFSGRNGALSDFFQAIFMGLYGVSN